MRQMSEFTRLHWGSMQRLHQDLAELKCLVKDLPQASVPVSQIDTENPS
jgi:hypothetical protein